MKRLFSLLAFMTFAVFVLAQDVVYQVKYKYSYDMQKYEYIDSLDYAEGTIVRLGESAVSINNERYEVVSKDSETADDKRKTVQYTTHNSKGEEFIICFAHELTFPEELAHQVIIFNTSNPYVWQYYITDAGKERR